MKYCEDCRWLEQTAEHAIKYRLCTHESAKRDPRGEELVARELARPLNQFASVQRGSTMPRDCGATGRFFEPKFNAPVIP